MSAAADAPPPPSARFGADADEPPFPADAVEVGRVLGAYGIKGWIRVQAFSGDPKALFSSKRWFLQPALPRPGAVPAPAAVAATPPQQPLPRLLRITQSRQQGDDVVAGAQEVPDRNAAEALKGARVFVARSSFPTAAEGEYYWVDLMGLAVFNREGQALGVVTDLLDTGAHSVLKLRGPACGADGQPDTAAPEVERLIPFVAAYVDQVDLPGRRITVDWGLDY